MPPVSIGDDAADMSPQKEFVRVSDTVSLIFDEHHTLWELVKAVKRARGIRIEVTVPARHPSFQSAVAMEYLSIALLRIKKEICFITHDPELQERLALYGLNAIAPRAPQELTEPPARDHLIRSFFKQPMRPFQRQKKKYLRGWWFILFIALAVILFLFTSITPRAHITLIPDVKVIERKAGVLINAEWPNQQRDAAHLRGKVLKEEGTYATTTPITDLSESGEKAKGEARIENQTGQEVALSIGTELLSDDGMVYVSESALTIPAAYVAEDATIKFGTLSATLTAKEPGVKGNRSSGRFTIPSLPSNKQQRIWAVITSPFTGGSDRMGKVVRQEHVAALEPLLWDRLQQDLFQTLESRLGNEWFVAFPLTTATVTNLTVDPPLGVEADAVSLNMKGTMQALAFSSADVLRAFGANVQICGSFQNGKSEVCAIRVDKVRKLDMEKRKGDAEFVFSKVQTPPFDPVALSEKITGKSVQQARLTLLSLPGVKDVRISLRWSLRNYIPRDADRITIEVAQQELTQP
ncbi:MAG: hypothetical protein WC659_04235 [Patescibacteria group bacterium]